MGGAMTRAEQARDFISRAGWASADVAALAGDASNRRYDRLTKADGSTAVLMDAAPEKGEDVRPFVHIAEYLTRLGLSAPRILHLDAEAGFLLIEDLGDRLFAREMARDPSLEQPLYMAAADVLSRLHQTSPPDLPRYDAATTVPLAALAYGWYQLGATNGMDVAARTEMADRLHPILAVFDPELSVLIQRDYHAENLLWLPDRTGVARVGLLDFQDAMLGHPVYDLVSILQDARRDVTPSTVRTVKDYFIQHNGLDRQDFEAAYAVFGLQRNLRILGVFARLCLRDGKAHYVDLIPRVWKYININLRHPVLEDLAPLISRDLPAPSSTICARLKEKRGQWSGR